MAGNSFHTAFAVGAFVTGGAVHAEIWLSFVFPITIPSGGGISQGFVFGADNLVAVFIISRFNIKTPGNNLLFRFLLLVS